MAIKKTLLLVLVPGCAVELLYALLDARFWVLGGQDSFSAVYDGDRFPAGFLEGGLGVFAERYAVAILGAHEYECLSDKADTPKEGRALSQYMMYLGEGFSRSMANQ